MINRVKNRPLIDKADFQFGRMDIHVYRLKGHVQMKHTGRKFSHHHAALERFFQSGHGGTAADKTAVDEKLLHTPVGAAVDRTADKAPHPNAVVFILHRHQTVGKIPSIHCIDGGFQLSVPGGMELFFAVPEKPQGNFRVRQGDFIQHTGDGVGFGHVFFQKFHPRRGVIK